MWHSRFCSTLVTDTNRPATNSPDTGTITVGSFVTKLYAIRTYILTVTRIYTFITVTVTDTTAVAITMSSVNFANWNRNHNTPFKIYCLFHVPPGLAFKTPTFQSQTVFTCFQRMSERRLFPVTALPNCMYNRGGVCLLCGTN